MAHRNQPKDEKHPYASPTTPGLFVTFRDYIIELVCLNVNSKIGPRFWSDRKYWGPKYGREVRGIFNISKELEFSDAIVQKATVQIIQEYRIKALVAKKTVTRVVRLVRSRIKLLTEQRKSLANIEQPEPIDSKKNATFVDTGKKTTLSKIREVENG